MRSSAESEMNGADDKIAKITWTKKFADDQGWVVEHSFIAQDDASTIKPLSDGRESAGKRTINLDMRFFMLNIWFQTKKWMLCVVQWKG